MAAYEELTSSFNAYVECMGEKPELILLGPLLFEEFLKDVGYDETDFIAPNEVRFKGIKVMRSDRVLMEF